MKRILAAVDFSDVSSAVIDQAEAMATAFSASLTLLHVAAPDPDFVGYEAGPQTVRDARADALREEHRELQQHAALLRSRGIDANAFLLEGATVEKILERAANLDADLVVMGSHGHGVWYRAIVGSVTEGVLRHATCPLLVVPANRSTNLDA